MIFHYPKNNKAICGRNVETRYLTDDWSMVDCKICLSHKDKSNTNKKLKFCGKYA